MLPSELRALAADAAAAAVAVFTDAQDVLRCATGNRHEQPSSLSDQRAKQPHCQVPRC
jgi:hypothetical protein